ncbi:MAG: hypothetical protein EHM72_01045 [Calditrichaeota bacterium]|nr:MAG: hypothetical protein EHM72_01045 [Calditrichota bacterium]
MKRFLFAILIVTIFVACAKKPVPDDALFKVGDRYVTFKEAQYRAEFAPHPNFPRFEKNLEKVFLNNYIMEKVFALEYGKTSELVRNERFVNYIKGRTEQAMRQQLFYEKAFNVVKLDSQQIRKTLALSQREYDLEFYTINSDSIAKKLKKAIADEPDSVVQIFNSIHEEKRPTWSVKWKDPDHINIHEALYSGPLARDSVIGPLQLDYDQWIIMKVVNWRDVLIFGGEEAQLRQKEIVEKLTMNKATRNWDNYTRNVMKGKEIDFDRDTFKKLADLSFDINRAENDQEKTTIMQRFWQEEDSTFTAADIPSGEAFLKQPFFTIDGTVWTVGDFRNELASHPLLYRKKAVTRGQFYQQFKIAVANLVRDHYLNEVAYKAGLDKKPEVVRTRELWHDALLAEYERDQLIKRIGQSLPDTTDPYRQTKLNKAFDDQLAELLAQHHSKVQVNDELFDQFAISNVQMFVLEENSPYPVAVPNWPMYSNSNRVDYRPLK